jgi:hypothetical protein
VPRGRGRPKIWCAAGGRCVGRRAPSTPAADGRDERAEGEAGVRRKPGVEPSRQGVISPVLEGTVPTSLRRVSTRGRRSSCNRAPPSRHRPGRYPTRDPLGLRAQTLFEGAWSSVGQEAGDCTCFRPTNPDDGVLTGVDQPAVVPSSGHRAPSKGLAPRSANKGRGVAASTLLLALVHTTTWKSRSTKLALRGFSEVQGTRAVCSVVVPSIKERIARYVTSPIKKCQRKWVPIGRTGQTSLSIVRKNRAAK